eukprot:TRINITY_DN124024_c0_g1_i1.p1 TRINITY_DN124024_c0_g1~~TRINITY_DN124024_c0_g1_i1.p1  ORF type:complete len:325 (-),score=103.17 TRINITY_DN124024_c0_g1_i1:101-1075(-)
MAEYHGPRGREPNEYPALDQPVDGVVYGQALAPENDHVPDVNGMMEAVGVPLTDELPHSLEWYAGAKDREAARQKEIDELLERKNDLRQYWAETVRASLMEAADKVAAIQAEPEPLDLAKTLARALHERPRDKAEAARLLALDKSIAGERDRLRVELAFIFDRITGLEVTVREKEAQDMAEEEERRAKVEAERKRKAKLERLLEKNAARLRGEDVRDSDSDEEAAAAQEGDAGAAAEGDGEAGQTSSGKEPTFLKPASDLQPAPDLQPASPVIPPPGQRGGLARELPPLRAPPPPPPISPNGAAGASPLPGSLESPEASPGGVE